MNKNKNCAKEIQQVKVPQLALPPTGPRLRLKSPNCRYTIYYALFFRAYTTHLKRYQIPDIFEKCL